MPKRAPIHRPRSGAPRYEPLAPSRQAKRAVATGSTRWHRQRERVLTRDGWTCKRCGGYGNHVDHIFGNSHELVGDEQLQVLCASCHSKKTIKENGGYGFKPRRPG